MNEDIDNAVSWRGWLYELLSRLFRLLPDRLQREVKEQRRKEEAWPTIQRGTDLFSGAPDEIAIEYLEEAVHRFPDNSQIRMIYGFSLLPSNREAGVCEVRRAVELDPYEPWCLIPAARKMFDFGRPDLARDYAARAREMGGENCVPWGPELILLDAQFALEDGDEEGAEAGFRLAVEREPESEWFAVVLAEFLTDQGRQEEALGVVRKALQTTKYRDMLSRLEAELSEIT